MNPAICWLEGRYGTKTCEEIPSTHSKASKPQLAWPAAFLYNPFPTALFQSINQTALLQKIIEKRPYCADSQRCSIFHPVPSPFHSVSAPMM